MKKKRVGQRLHESLMLKKMLTIMKLTTLLFFLALMQVTASSFSQNSKLTLDFKDRKLEEIFSDIERMTDYSIFYKNELIEKSGLKTGKYNDRDVFAVLDDVLKDEKLSYEVRGKLILIVSKGQSDDGNAGFVQQPTNVKGKVTDSSGAPLPGVTVVVKGTTTGTITDTDGYFNLTQVPGDATLIFSFVGMRSQETLVSGKNNINVIMEEETVGIEEVVAIGYGVTTKKDLTGSVATVKGDQFQNVPTSRVDQIMQGRASGVQVTQTNGAPGAGSTIRIRGGNSIQGDNEPLYVVDGFIVGTDFNLNNINVNDIESIDILKDATSISIYGTRGANGVILITTKSGQNQAPGKPLVSVNVYSGIQQLKSSIDFANGPELAYLANLDAENRGAALPFPDVDQVPDVDWIDQITETAPMTNIDVSVSGQSDNRNLNYYVSGNYFNQDGIVRNSGIEKYIFRTNMDLKLSEKFSLGFRLNITRLKTENNKVNLSSMWSENSSAIPVRGVYNEDGTFTSKNPITASVQRNAEADIQLRVDHDYVTNILGNIYLQYEPIKGLIIKSSIGPKINHFKNDFYLPGILPERSASLLGGYARINSNESTDILNENTITYTKQINENHKFDVLAGFTWQTYDQESYRAEAEGFTNDVVEFNNLELGDPARNVVASGYNSYQLVSWFGRINYSFKEKYLLTLVGRVDGSSRFAGSDNKYAFFPSGSFAWRLIEEPWIKSLNVFDNLKLRTSYGISGSQAIGSYRTMATLDTQNMFFNGTEQPGVRNGRPASPELKWETTKQLDIGLESAYWGGRLSVEIDYYHKKTKDLLLNVEIPRQTGFSTKLQNMGEIQNHGLELLINTINMKKKYFSWETTLSLAGNRSKVLDIGPSEYLNIASPTNQGGPGGRLYVGKPVPVFVGVEYLGVWKSQEEIDASGMQNQLVGGPRFKDANGDKVISETDFEVLGSPEPKFYGGIMNSFSYRNFKLDIYFNGSYGNELFNSVTQQSFFFREGANAYSMLLNHWDPVTNPDSDIPMPGTSQSLANIKNNSKEIEDGSYLRLKSVRLSYDIPQQILRRIDWLKNLSIYFSGTNLALWSKNKLFDPEVNRYANSGNTNEGVQLGFSQGEYPYARTMTIGLKADF